ncbi:MAG: methyl-accepting chemotaxis protein [Firmicutes bacterium]|nr:methyl-accepting chemotaxis protein [Bacillota bacterium]
MKKKTSQQLLNADKAALLACMDKIMEGDCSLSSPVPFQDAELEQKWKRFMLYILNANNKSAMQLNDSMTVIGDSSCVKVMLEQVSSQSLAIEEMNHSSQELGDSILNIQESASSIRDSSRDLTDTTNTCIRQLDDSIHIIDDSSGQIQQINGQISDFKEKAVQITDIVDMVKKLASKSSLLALNASIEAARAGQAGKGFSVVAGQMQDLAANTSASADDINRYVGELMSGIDTLASSVQSATACLQSGNEAIHHSVESVDTMGQKISFIAEKIDLINEEIRTQSGLTQSFVKAVESLDANYETLSKECLDTGVHLYRISRSIDTIRTAVAKGTSRLFPQDWLTVYAVDHLIFTWRLYNNLAGFETLKITQLNNPKGCKFGKWAASQTDRRITDSREFKQAVSCHEELHRCACDSWNAKDGGDKEEALRHFHKALEIYGRFSSAIDSLKKLLAANGDKEYTDINA